MKALLTGANGQLGQDVARQTPGDVKLCALTKTELDIGDMASVTSIMSAERPDVVINTAAYTAVDAAEENSELAQRVNHLGCENLAKSCQEYGVRLLHVSTDYVFDGQSNKPYAPDDTTNPIGVYGQSKLAGEQAILALDNLQSNIVRASWLYGEHGNNFVHTMLRLMNEREELGIVMDQVGCPTWTKPLATHLWQLARQEHVVGVWHWSDLGVSSWYDFAVAIHRIGRQLKLIQRDVVIRPINTCDYPTPAKRPTFSVLDSSALRSKLSVSSAHWRENLFTMLESKVNV